MRQLVPTAQKGQILGSFCSVNLIKLVYLLKLNAVLAENDENVNGLNIQDSCNVRE